MTGPPPPPPPPEPYRSQRWGTMPGAPRWGDTSVNPRTYPFRHPVVVEAEVKRSAAQRAELEAMMDRTGQRDALVIAPLEVELGPGPGAYSSMTWAEGRITVLETADVLVLFELPDGLGAAPTITRVRWDVVARVCGADCWSTVPDLAPRRVITRRWPTAAHLEVIKALSLPDPPAR